VGDIVKLAEKLSLPLNQLPTAEVQQINSAYGSDWLEVFDLKRALAKRTGTGMPGPKQVAKQFARWQKVLK
jgi:argininosuccinate lyase